MSAHAARFVHGELRKRAGVEYIHKAAGIVAVSAGPFGGTRVFESSLPVLRDQGWSRSSGT